MKVDEMALLTRGPQETQHVAAAIAQQLRPGDVVALTGELGAGKTCFVQGAARALGVAERVTSPSFLLRRDYRGRMPVLHLDVYRLETLSQVVDLGYEDVLDADGIVFIEWGDAMAQLLPAGHLEVELRLGAPDPTGDGEAEERLITLRPRGDDWHRRLAAATDALAPWRTGPVGER